MRRCIRIGSRESRLAVVQTRLVADYIQEALPEAEVRLVTMKTTGDRILDRPLEAVGGKGHRRLDWLLRLEQRPARQ